MLQSMKKYDCNTCTLYFKKNRIDNFEHWPASIKTTIEWFPFLEMMEYTGNDIKNDVRGVSFFMSFPVYSIISRKGNHSIVVFIDAGQCSKLSIRLIFLVKGKCVKDIFF